MINYYFNYYFNIILILLINQIYFSLSYIEYYVEKTTIKEKLHNYQNLQYFGSIYVGSNFKKFSVIFDTGSNLLWLPSYKCHNCRDSERKFNNLNSETFQNKNQTKEIIYAKGYVKGSMANDIVSLNYHRNYTNIKDYVKLNFLLVNDEKDLNGTMADGVLGLGNNFEGNKHNSFVYQMYLNKIIDKPKFSFVINNISKKSKIIFGSNNINYKSNCSITSGLNYWGCRFNKIEIKDESNNVYSSIKGIINDKDTNNNFNSNTIYSNIAVFDTGSSFYILPYEYMVNIVESINKYYKSSNMKCYITEEVNQLVCDCNIHYRNPYFIFYLISDIYYIQQLSIQFKDMLFFNDYSTNMCYYEAVASKQLNFFILGDTILRNLIIEFDMENNKINYVEKHTLNTSKELEIIYIGRLIIYLGIISVCLLFSLRLIKILFK